LGRFIPRTEELFPSGHFRSPTKALEQEFTCASMLHREPLVQRCLCNTISLILCLVLK